MPHARIIAAALLCAFMFAAGAAEAKPRSANPFAWTKSEVHQKRLKPRFADQ